MNLIDYAPKPMLPATSDRGIEAVRRIEERLLQTPQVDVVTHHVLHAGVYSRTLTMPAGTALTGALIKIATTLVVSGHCTVLLGDGEEVRIQGTHVLAASAGRKQAYIAHDDTTLVMSFATQARTVEQAEEEFTDEADRLLSRRGRNVVTITGE